MYIAAYEFDTKELENKMYVYNLLKPKYKKARRKLRVFLRLNEAMGRSFNRPQYPAANERRIAVNVATNSHQVLVFCIKKK